MGRFIIKKQVASYLAVLQRISKLTEHGGSWKGVGPATCHEKRLSQSEWHDILERMNAPARAIACRPAVSCWWNSGHAWIMSGHISNVTAKSAAPATLARRTASSRRVSDEPT